MTTVAPPHPPHGLGPRVQTACIASLCRPASARKPPGQLSVRCIRRLDPVQRSYQPALRKDGERSLFCRERPVRNATTRIEWPRRESQYRQLAARLQGFVVDIEGARPRFFFVLPGRPDSGWPALHRRRRGFNRIDSHFFGFVSVRA